MTTVETVAEAESLAEFLVEDRLAACVNVLPGIRSVYRWQGRIEKGGEIMLLIKTTEARYGTLEAAIQARSGYELPEIVAVRIASGSSAFLNWITDAVND
jgi:periplasmic divalent cation tolerance protein